MVTFVDNPKALPTWRFVFVCKSERCLDERLTELKELEKKFPEYQYTYKWQHVGKNYVVRLINVTLR